MHQLFVNDAHAPSGRKGVRLLAALITCGVAMALVAAPAAPASAAGHTVVINGGGGTSASDGLHIELNRGISSRFEQIFFNGQVQYFTTPSGNAGPHLSVGGTLFGPASASGAEWSAIEVLDTSGSAVTATSSSTVGSGGATIRYSAIVDDLDYIVERRLSYTYPNNYFTDDYTFVIPDGNTSAVKFYAGGDTTPGGSDVGYGIMLTSPVRAAISLNPSSGVQIGYREVAGSRPFSGAVAQQYNTPYPTLQAGGDIGFAVVTTDHDAGIMMQWTLGSTPGTYTGAFQTFVGEQNASLNASFGALSAAIGTSVDLTLSVDNTLLTPVTGLGYTFTLPTGLTVSAGAQANGCGGTLDATIDGTTIALSGGAVAAADNCVVSIPVVAETSGTYTITSGSASGFSELSNGVGTASLTFGTVPTPPVASVPELNVDASVHIVLTSDADPAPTFTVSAGTLPAGLTLDSATGILSGTPTTTGPYSFTITATNAISSASHTFSGTIEPPLILPVWTTAGLGTLTMGEDFALTLVATGTPAPTFTVTAGTLPAGLTLDSATGILAGTPTTSGAYSFTITATNTAGSASRTFSGTIEPPLPIRPVWTTADLGTLTVGEDFALTLVATGTPAPTFTVTAGSLPSGLTLDSATGILSGTPRAPGDYDVTITASNGAGDTGQRFAGTAGTIAADLKLVLALSIGTTPDAGGNSFTATAEGMLPGSSYSIVLRSTPVVLFTGTVPSSGRISQTLRLPAGIPAGVHSVTIVGTAATGSAASAAAWFRVGDDGTVTGVSQVSASELASTGVESHGTVVAAVLLLLSGTSALIYSARRRRRA